MNIQLWMLDYWFIQKSLLSLQQQTPKQAAKVIVMNNNEAANTRTQLIKLINKIKSIQNFEVEKDGN